MASRQEPVEPEAIRELISARWQQRGGAAADARFDRKEAQAREIIERELRAALEGPLTWVTMVQCGRIVTVTEQLTQRGVSHHGYPSESGPRRASTPSPDASTSNRGWSASHARAKWRPSHSPEPSPTSNCAWPDSLSAAKVLADSLCERGDVRGSWPRGRWRGKTRSNWWRAMPAR